MINCVFVVRSYLVSNYRGVSNTKRKTIRKGPRFSEVDREAILYNNHLTAKRKMSKPLLHLAHHTLSGKTPTDLPPSILILLPHRSDAILRLARERLHTYPYASVPILWRRAFTEASLYLTCQAIFQALDDDGNADVVNSPSHCADQEAGKLSEGGGDWIQEVVEKLDMALIMAGGAGREDDIERLFSMLEVYLEDSTANSDLQANSSRPRPTKKRLLYPSSSLWSYVGDSWPPPSATISIPTITQPIHTLTNPSMLDFQAHFSAPHPDGPQPLLIKGSMTHWPAMMRGGERDWSSPDYFHKKTLGGRRLVPVEVGRSYTDEGWGQKILSWGGFVGEYILGISPEQKKDGEGKKRTTGYLAQHDLFAQIPSLRKDIAVPDYCYIDIPPTSSLPSSSSSPPISSPTPPPPSSPILNAWFGPPGTISPLHTDPHHNILTQVVGAKYVRLYSPRATANLYARGKSEQGGGIDMSNTSFVMDVEGGGGEEGGGKFPLFYKEVGYVECVLRAGEGLFIPRGWWHYVRGLEVSFSVSFWWD